MFMTALFAVAKTRINLSMMDGWVGKENMLYISNGILFRHHKKEISLFDNMDGP